MAMEKQTLTNARTDFDAATLNGHNEGYGRGSMSNDHKSCGRMSEESLCDDPPWYKAPRGSLQAALPENIMKQASNVSNSNSNPASDTASSHDPVSPSRSSLPSDEDEEKEDLVSSLTRARPPTHKKKQHIPGPGVPVHLKGHSHKPPHLSIQRLSLQDSNEVLNKTGSSDSINDDSKSPDTEATPQMMVGGIVGNATRESFDTRGSIGMRGSLDVRESMDVNGPNGGYRDSILRYRPSDLNVNEVKGAFIARDSLAYIQDEEYARHTMGRISASRVPDHALPELLKAAKNGNVMIIKACLQDRNTDFTQRDPQHGQTALHLAVRHGQFTVVRLLCHRKIRKLLIDAVDNRQNTPLHLAAAKSRRICKFLLEQGADVTKINARNQTALGVHILTTKRDEPLIAEMLLQHKSDANAALDKSTLIHKAVELSLHEIACRLVRYGARLDIKDEHNKMVFDKVNRKILRQLFTKISYPPVWVPDEEKEHCMLCSRKFNRFNIGIRRHHCRHCGRICCGQCSYVSVESVAFPKTFEFRFKKGGVTRNNVLKRVCRTCSIVFKERQKPVEEKKKSRDFYQKVMGCEWEEITGQQNAPRSSLV